MNCVLYIIYILEKDIFHYILLFAAIVMADSLFSLYYYKILRVFVHVTSLRKF